MIKNVSKKPLVGLLVLLTVGGVLTSCSLPPHLRYQYIDNVVKQVDYESAGEVKIARYDNGDGVFSPSFFYAEIIGEVQTYEDIKTDILKIEGIECVLPHSSGYLDCHVGQADIYLNLADERIPSIVAFRVTDVFSGRDPK